MNISGPPLDQMLSALIADLYLRGLDKKVMLVVWGEFGRTPTSEGVGKPGRDHNWRGFSMWLAGGGIKGGISHGATDELGYAAVEDKVHVNDLHATMLHLFGIQHLKLTYRFQGRDFRLTDVSGHVVQKLLA